ncbi:MAG TPA: [acyl-carrier-protein] S-malonyltransferase [Lentisphaeria bacterium]|jgi:malonyl CoA-acyl carrier protein transacylase|nr:[acyl-carrier-protein] S-malonyltransferase [Lentisphaeria bacterium]
MATAFLFPGQGSQTIGMGAELFDQFPQRLAEADEILGYSLRSLCLEDPDGLLNNTQYTQPALFVVDALSYDARGADQEVAFMAGHSLGEYAALYAGGVLDFASGVRLAKARGELMARVTGGGMAAILGLAADDIAAVIRVANLATLDMANFNTLGQTVISGPAADIVAAESAFKDAGAKRYVVLNVSGAFHSRYMKDPAEQFRVHLESTSFQAAVTPVIANVTAQPYEAGQAIDNLCSQIHSPVRWTETIQSLIEQGVDSFEELGPGRVLAGTVKQIQRGR